jgi:DNA-binding MarR family transcriptional regulator
MDPSEYPSPENLRRAVDAFWDVLLPFWNQVRAHIRQTAVEEHDLTVEQFHILRHIRRGFTSVSELALAKNISRPAASQAVDGLVKKGFILREQGMRDRRVVRLALTPAGDALLDTIFEETRRWMMSVLAPLSDEELDRLVLALASLKKIQVA